MKQFIFLTLILLFSTVYSQSKEKIPGPIINNFGYVYKIDSAELLLETNKNYKVIFDVYSDNSNGKKINPLINTIARFLNMHGQQGVPLKNMDVVLVLHGSAAKNVIDTEENPNIELLRALKKVNVQIFVCGQSLKSRNLDQSKVSKDVKVALSAMTALVKFQSEGYNIINFN